MKYIQKQILHMMQMMVFALMVTQTQQVFSSQNSDNTKQEKISEMQKVENSNNNAIVPTMVTSVEVTTPLVTSITREVVEKEVEEPMTRQDKIRAYTYATYQKMMASIHVVLHEAWQTTKNLVERIDQSVHEYVNKRKS
jgi:hypothetical protein